jgi:hypothetical protein
MTRFVILGAVALCTGALATGPVLAQAGPRTVDVVALLDGFQRDAANGGRGASTSTLSEMMLFGERFHPADVDRVSRELERLAVEGSASSVRGQAAWVFALAGARGIAHPRSDIVARCARLYARSADPWVQEQLVRVMRFQADEPAAIQFLSGVITAPPPKASDDTPGRYAVILLAAMGANGQAELRRLDQPGRVVDAAARRQLDAVAKLGYHNH